MPEPINATSQKEPFPCCICGRQIASFEMFISTGCHVSCGGAIETLRNLARIQRQPGNWNCNPYMHGMANGLELAMATIESREPQYLNTPEVWLDDLPGQGFTGGFILLINEIRAIVRNLKNPPTCEAHPGNDNFDCGWETLWMLMDSGIRKRLEACGLAVPQPEVAGGVAKTKICSYRPDVTCIEGKSCQCCEYNNAVGPAPFGEINQGQCSGVRGTGSGGNSKD